MNHANVSGPMPASTCHWGNAMKAIDKILSLDDRVDTVFPAHMWVNVASTSPKFATHRPS
ncbi:hypothetical protein MVEG_08265 [Podila verticillata NRRL 6337]|nr:hypothetical protein MVEG_08265 [Podila verticillata NRRL 6337]